MVNVFANLASISIRVKLSAKSARATALNAFQNQYAQIAKLQVTSPSKVLASPRFANLDLIEIHSQDFACLAPLTVLRALKELISAKLAPIQARNSLQKQGFALHVSLALKVRAYRLVNANRVTFSIRLKKFASLVPTHIVKHVKTQAANVSFAKIIFSLTW